MNEWMNECINGWIYKWMNGNRNEQTNECMIRWRDGWIGEWIKVNKQTDTKFSLDSICTGTCSVLRSVAICSCIVLVSSSYSSCMVARATPISPSSRARSDASRRNASADSPLSSPGGQKNNHDIITRKYLKKKNLTLSLSSPGGHKTIMSSKPANFFLSLYRDIQTLGIYVS